MKKYAYFSKDFTRTAVIEETVLLPRIEFEYRPLTMLDTALLTDQVMHANINIEKATQKNLEMLSKHIVKWDLMGVDNLGCESCIDFNKVTELEKVSPIIINQIIGLVRGDAGNPYLDKKDVDAQLKN